MAMQPNPINPTPEQIEQTRRVEQALCNEINLLAREGIPLACLLTGIATTAADLITCQVGAQAVPAWFENNGKMAREAQEPRA